MKRIWKNMSVLLCMIFIISIPANVYATEKTAADYRQQIQDRRQSAQDNKQEIEASESKVDQMEEQVAGLNSEKKRAADREKRTEFHGKGA